MCRGDDLRFQMRAIIDGLTLFRSNYCFYCFTILFCSDDLSHFCMYSYNSIKCFFFSLHLVTYQVQTLMFSLDEDFIVLDIFL